MPFLLGPVLKVTAAISLDRRPQLTVAPSYQCKIPAAPLTMPGSGAFAGNALQCTAESGASSDPPQITAAAVYSR